MIETEDKSVMLGPVVNVQGILNLKMRSISCNILTRPLVYGYLQDSMVLRKGSEFTKFFKHHIAKLQVCNIADKVQLKPNLDIAGERGG